MARDENDVRGTKAARAELAKRGVDVTMADLRCMHGVLYVRGTVKPYRGSPITDIRAEMEIVARVLRQKAEIRDVVLECVYRQ